VPIPLIGKILRFGSVGLQGLSLHQVEAEAQPPNEKRNLGFIGGGTGMGAALGAIAGGGRAH
jgi:hypothetical protein